MKTILVLTDFSKRAEHAAELALQIARNVQAEIILYNAFPVQPVIPAETMGYPFYENYSVLEKQSLLQLEKTAENLKKNFKQLYGINPPPIHLQNSLGTVADNISQILNDTEIWMIVMGDKSKDGTLKRFIFGSESYEVIDRTTCPVLLVPERKSIRQIEKVALSTDLKESQKKVVPFLKQLAESFSFEVIMIHVHEHILSSEERVKHMDYYRLMKPSFENFDSSYLDVLGSDIAETLDNFTFTAGIDILAIQHKKRSVLAELLHRSICKKMIDYNHIPLLVIPEM